MPDSLLQWDGSKGIVLFELDANSDETPELYLYIWILGEILSSDTGCAVTADNGSET